MDICMVKQVKQRYRYEDGRYTLFEFNTSQLTPLFVFVQDSIREI